MGERPRDEAATVLESSLSRRDGERGPPRDQIGLTLEYGMARGFESKDVETIAALEAQSLNHG
jgi:hypothetical protein